MSRTTDRNLCVFVKKTPQILSMILACKTLRIEEVTIPGKDLLDPEKWSRPWQFVGQRVDELATAGGMAHVMVVMRMIGLGHWGHQTEYEQRLHHCSPKVTVHYITKMFQRKSFSWWEPLKALRVSCLFWWIVGSRGWRRSSCTKKKRKGGEKTSSVGAMRLFQILWCHAGVRVRQRAPLWKTILFFCRPCADFSAR